MTKKVDLRFERTVSVTKSVPVPRKDVNLNKFPQESTQINAKSLFEVFNRRSASQPTKLASI